MPRSQIPLVLTSMRLGLVIVIYGAILSGLEWLALPLFIVAGITDLLDGHMARKLKATTKFGARLDSIADYALLGSVPIWIAMTARSAFLNVLVQPLAMIAVVSIIYICVRVVVHRPSFFHLPSAKLASALCFGAGALFLGGYTDVWPAWLAGSALVLAEIEEIAILLGVNEVRR